MSRHSRQSARTGVPSLFELYGNSGRAPPAAQLLSYPRRGRLRRDMRDAVDHSRARFGECASALPGRLRLRMFGDATCGRLLDRTFLIFNFRFAIADFGESAERRLATVT